MILCRIIKRLTAAVLVKLLFGVLCGAVQCTSAQCAQFAVTYQDGDILHDDII